MPFLLSDDRGKRAMYMQNVIIFVKACWGKFTKACDFVILPKMHAGTKKRRHVKKSERAIYVFTVYYHSIWAKNLRLKQHASR